MSGRLGVFGKSLQRVLADLGMGIGEGRHPERRDDHLAGRTKRRELPHRRRRQPADVWERTLQQARQLADRGRVVPAPQLQRALALLVLEDLLGIASHQDSLAPLVPS